MDRPNDASLILLRRTRTAPIVERVRALYEATDGPEQVGRYSDGDWSRIDWAYRLVQRGGRVLDVGIGAGELVNVLAGSGEFLEVHAADVREHSGFRDLYGGIHVHRHRVEALGFPDDHFDVVTCLEVLEHLEDDVLTRALAELRRVCRCQLLVTVPFAEPEPLPPYHRQRFLADGLRARFPRGSYTLLREGVRAWAFVEERFPTPEPGHPRS